jgi:hypothetical protein
MNNCNAAVMQRIRSVADKKRNRKELKRSKKKVKERNKQNKEVIHHVLHHRRKVVCSLLAV